MEHGGECEFPHGGFQCLRLRRDIDAQIQFTNTLAKPVLSILRDFHHALSLTALVYAKCVYLPRVMEKTKDHHAHVIGVAACGEEVASTPDFRRILFMVGEI